MSENSNSNSTVFYRGSIPRHYDEYLGPMFFEPYAIEVARRIDHSSIDIALELACGTGRVTRHLRNILPASSKLIASDISSDMLAIAKENLQGLDIDWEILNIQRLPFADGSIDLVVCCFGYMFSPDKVKAYSEAHRALKPGGLLLFTTWDKLENNEASYAYRMIAKKYLTEPIPEIFKLAYAMHDIEEIRRDLDSAGFDQISIEKINKISVSASAKEAAIGLARGGAIYNEIMKRNPAWVDEIEEQVEHDLTQKYGAAPVEAPMSALIIEARK
jgi:ubiquinone/menaquinone biosynthesis C-methylase UbiE